MTKPAPATLKLRMHERLRTAIEEEAGRNGSSLNAEIVRRLADSFITVTPDVLGAYQELAMVLVDLNGLQSEVIGLVTEVEHNERALARLVQTAQAFSPLQLKLTRAMNVLMPRAGEKGRDK